MTRRFGSALLGTWVALVARPSAWAQQAQGGGPPEPAAVLSSLCMTVIPLFALGVIVYALVGSRRVQRQNLGQVDRSLALAEESVRLTREQVARQEETNRLLKELIETLRRN